MRENKCFLYEESLATGLLSTFKDLSAFNPFCGVLERRGEDGRGGECEINRISTNQTIQGSNVLELIVRQAKVCELLAGNW
jgi:hypothetical protein